MNKQEFITQVWNYYLMLENDFLKTFQYVEFSHDNDMTFSKEYVKQLLSIGSNIDVVCKELCRSINSETRAKNINDYCAIIKNHNDFFNTSITCLSNNEIMTPWITWNNAINPEWWNNYNKVKHNRIMDEQYKLGNLKNVVEALSGLYILCRVLYKRIDRTEPNPHSQLFIINGWSVYTPMSNGMNMVLEPHGDFYMR